MTPDNTRSPSSHASGQNLADYRQYYGLTGDPFESNAQIPFYGGGERRQLLEKLEHLCQFSASLLVVMGEPGSGKTRLARELSNSFESEDEICLISARADCSSLEILTEIADCFSLLSDSHPSLGQLLASLRRFGQSADELDSLALVVIDDAQHLSEQTLGELTSLLQGQDAGGRRLHIVLFAEPQIANRLDQFQLQEVLIHDFYLEPFSLSEATDYLNFRMEAAGYIGPELFNELLVEPWWRRAEGRLPILHQAARQWLLASVQPPPERPKSKLPLVHIVTIALLLGLLMMAYLYSGNDDELPLQESNLADRVPQDSGPGLQPVSVPESDRAEDRRVAQPLNLIVPSPQPDDAEDALEAESLPKPETAEVESPPLSAPEAELETDPESATSVAEQASEKPPKTQAGPAPEEKPVELPQLPEDEKVLLSWRPGDYTLQLLGAHSERSVRDYMSRQPNRNQLLRYQSQRQGKPWYVVVVGRYQTSAEARRAMEQLPEGQRKAGPWPRPLKEIQEEIKKQRGL